MAFLLYQAAQLTIHTCLQNRISQMCQCQAAEGRAVKQPSSGRLPGPQCLEAEVQQGGNTEGCTWEGSHLGSLPGIASLLAMCLCTCLWTFPFLLSSLIKTGITTLISKGLGIDEKHIAHCGDIRKLSSLPTWAVCVFEAHLDPERTEGSLCLTLTAAQLYQHHAPPTRAGDSPGDRQLLPPGAHLQAERAYGEESHGASSGERRQDLLLCLRSRFGPEWGRDYFQNS